MPHLAPRYTIAGSRIEFVDNFNFLGITIDKHLSWTCHINLLCAKIYKITGIIQTKKCSACRYTEDNLPLFIPLSFDLWSVALGCPAQ